MPGIDRFLLRPPRYLFAVSTAAGLAVSWGVNVAAGGSNAVPPHLFYLPIFLASSLVGPWAGAMAAAAAGVLAGPLLPADVSAGVAQNTSDWVLRTVFFVVIGWLVGAGLRQWRHALQRQVSLAEAESDLALRKAAFLQVVSHELRTPLAVVRGVSATMVRKDLPEDERRPMVETLQRGVDRLESLCSGALAAAGALDDVAGPIEMVDVDQLVHDLAEDMSSLSGPQRLRMPAGTHVIRAQRQLLRPLLRALLENALKFSPAHEPVDVSMNEDAIGIEIALRDHGKGLDADVEDLFNAFGQADPSTTRSSGGLGIGLYAARRIAYVLGCELFLENHPDGGAVARVRFPKRAAVSAA